jgi:hypothetical protein
MTHNKFDIQRPTPRRARHVSLPYPHVRYSPVRSAEYERLSPLPDDFVSRGRVFTTPKDELIPSLLDFEGDSVHGDEPGYLEKLCGALRTLRDYLLGRGL